MRKKIVSGFLFVLGFLLSPLSWWNDLFINLPLSYLGAAFVGVFFEKLFLPAMIFFYWLTNILGLLLMHYGVAGLKGEGLNRKQIFSNLITIFFYTVVVVCLVYFGVLKLPSEYFLR